MTVVLWEVVPRPSQDVAAPQEREDPRRGALWVDGGAGLGGAAADLGALSPRKTERELARPSRPFPRRSSYSISGPRRRPHDARLGGGGLELQWKAQGRMDSQHRGSLPARQVSAQCLGSRHMPPGADGAGGTIPMSQAQKVTQPTPLDTDPERHSPVRWSVGPSIPALWGWQEPRTGGEGVGSTAVSEADPVLLSWGS